MSVPLIRACAAASGECTPERYGNMASEDDQE